MLKGVLVCYNKNPQQVVFFFKTKWANRLLISQFIYFSRRGRQTCGTIISFNIKSITQQFSKLNINTSQPQTLLYIATLKTIIRKEVFQ
jgi:hypothetical protein